MLYNFDPFLGCKLKNHKAKCWYKIILFFQQVIQWMQNPTELTALRDFTEWKEKCDVKGQPYCSLPNPCARNTRELPGETLRLHTCMECPNNYPWILDPTGDGFSFK